MPPLVLPAVGDRVDVVISGVVLGTVVSPDVVTSIVGVEVVLLVVETVISGVVLGTVVSPDVVMVVETVISEVVANEVVL